MDDASLVALYLVVRAAVVTGGRRANARPIAWRNPPEGARARGVAVPRHRLAPPRGAVRPQAAVPA